MAAGTRLPPQQRSQRDRPGSRELRGQRGSGGMAPCEPAVAVAGNERNDISDRPRHRGDDETGRHGCQVASAALLPRGDEGTGAVLIDERGACACKCQPAAAALGAAANGPRPRRPTAFTARGEAPHETREAGSTDRGADPATDAAAAREYHLEELHPTDGRDPRASGACRLCAKTALLPPLIRSAPRRTRLSGGSS